MIPVLCFLSAHLPNHGAASSVFLRKTFQVGVEMLAYLPLSLGNEAQAPSIPERAARGPDEKRPGVPYRCQSTGRFPEFLESALTPCKVVEFFNRCVLYLRFYIVVARHGSVPLVQRLRRHFAGMIYPHEARRVPPLLFVKFGIGNVSCRIRPSGVAGGRGNGSKRVVRARK